MTKLDIIKLLELFFEGKATQEDIRILLTSLNNIKNEDDLLKDSWEAASDSMNPLVQQRIFANISATIAPKRRFNLRKFITVAASVLLVFTTSLSGYFLIRETKSIVQNDMRIGVERGQKANVTLPDGTKIWINSGSTLNYGTRFNDKERVVKLNGEAYFEVAHNPNAPFIVQCRDMSVRALGTAFDVKAYDEDQKISTVLIKGKVEVGDSLNKIILHPNQKLVYDYKTKAMDKKDVDDGNVYLSWRSDKMVFESERFENIAMTLERNYNMKIVFKSNRLKKYRFSGTIQNTSIESVIQLFSLTSPLTYQIQGSTIYIDEDKALLSKYKKIINPN